MEVNDEVVPEMVALLRRYSKGLQRIERGYRGLPPHPDDDGEEIDLNHAEIDALLARAVRDG